MTITGCLPNHEWKEDDLIYVPIQGGHNLMDQFFMHSQPNIRQHSNYLKVEKVIEQRDHSGSQTLISN